MTHPDVHSHEHEEQWRALLSGEVRGLNLTRRLVGWMPAGPRCKLCLAPLKPPGSVLLKLVGFGPSRLNRRLCRACFRSVERHPGGAEIELSFLFADVRGSTSLAEHLPAQEYSRLISRFYGKAAEVVDKWDGLVDKFVGDEVVALFVPGFVEGNPAEKAVSAARELLRETGNDGGDPWIPVGAGVHTGVAYVGRVGEGDACDFTAVGDAANLTARLASSAGAREILVSATALRASGIDTAGLETRTLEFRGRVDRRHPLVPRGSKRFGELYRGRAAVEREFGNLKHRYALPPLRVRGLARVQLHADLTMLTRLSQALARARAVPLVA